MVRRAILLALLGVWLAAASGCGGSHAEPKAQGPVDTRIQRPGANQPGGR